MFTLNENGNLVVEVTRPNGMAHKFEFEPKTEFILDNNCCILRKTAIHRMVTELQIEVSVPDIKPISNTMVIVRAAKLGERVEYAIGEASDKSLESDIAKKYPILTADNRAYQRAVLQVLGLAGRVYGEDEMRSDPFAVPQESYENPRPEKKAEPSKPKPTTDKTSEKTNTSSNTKNEKSKKPEVVEESYEAVHDGYEEESYEAVQDEPKRRGRPPKNTKPADAKSAQSDTASKETVENTEDSYEAVHDEKPRPADEKVSQQKVVKTIAPQPSPEKPKSSSEPPKYTSFEVRPEHSQEHPWLTQESANDCLKVNPYTTTIEVGKWRNKNLTAFDIINEPNFTWLLNKGMTGTNEVFDNSIRAARAAAIYRIIEGK